MKLEVEKGNAELERSHTQSKRHLAHARNIDISQITLKTYFRSLTLQFVQCPVRKIKMPFPGS